MRMMKIDKHNDPNRIAKQFGNDDIKEVNPYIGLNWRIVILSSDIQRISVKRLKGTKGSSLEYNTNIYKDILNKLDVTNETKKLLDEYSSEMMDYQIAEIDNSIKILKKTITRLLETYADVLI